MIIILSHVHLKILFNINKALKLNKKYFFVEVLSQAGINDTLPRPKKKFVLRKKSFKKY